MSPFAVVRLLFWAAILSSCLAFATDQKFWKVLRAHWKLIVVLLLVVVLWRLPSSGRFFHGLEYEDSYVYTVAGRQLLANSGTPSEVLLRSYSVNVCGIGSTQSCLAWESFPEHFIGYPYLIYSLARMFGYSSEIGSVANVAAACVSDVLVFCIILFLTESAVTAGLGAFVLALTPVFAVYGLETSAEPVASLCVTLAAWLFIRTVADSQTLWCRAIQWTAFSAAVLWSLTVKRENILLAFVFAIMTPLIGVARGSSSTTRRALILALMSTTAVALALSFRMGLLATSESEMSLLRQFPVSTTGFLRFAFAFVRSFFVMKWYAGTVFAVLFGLWFCLKRRGVALLPALLLVAYLFTYAFHIRSYYEMRSGYVEPSAALRFSMTFMGPWSILAGIGIGSIVNRLKRTLQMQLKTLQIAGVSLFLVTLIVSFVTTRRLYNYEVEDEIRSRLTPAFAAICAASVGDGNPKFILSLEPLVIQMYGADDIPVVDLESVGSDDLASFASSGYLTDTVVIQESNRNTVADTTRYGSQLGYLKTLPQDTVLVGDSFSITRLRR